METKEILNQIQHDEKKNCHSRARHGNLSEEDCRIESDNDTTCKTDKNINIQKVQIRNSSVELVKILAMFMIVISHVAQTLGSPHPELSYSAEIFFDSMHSARDFQHFVILIFRHFGSFGNNLFFISSAWFLCGSKKSRTQRIFQILCDVWILSILSLVVSLTTGVHLPKKEIIKILFPSTFEINW